MEKVVSDKEEKMRQIIWYGAGKNLRDYEKEFVAETLVYIKKRSYVCIRFCCTD